MKLYHTTTTGSAKAILEQGLNADQNPCELVVHLSTKDECMLIKFFGEMNGLYEDFDEDPIDTITVLEVDVEGLELQWPGEDGDHHYYSLVSIPAERIRAVKEYSLEEVKAMPDGADESGTFVLWSSTLDV